jgi:FkbM family methyltransferase
MNAVESIIKRVKSGAGLSGESVLVKAFRPAYDAALQALYGRKGIKREIHGEEAIFLKPQHRACSEDAEPKVFAALKERTKQGSVVLDIGANVGVYSLLMARWVGPSGKVYAFEPAPQTLQDLRAHVAMNKMSERIEVVGQALSDQKGEAVFYAHSVSGENSLNPGFAKRLSEAQALKVPVTTVDDFCESNNIAPTLLKIDVEGFEFHVLRGAQKTLFRHRPSLVIEMHPMFWKEIGVTVEALHETFSKLNYRIMPLEEQSPLSEFGHIALDPLI